jgi:ABC-type transport system involved in multi-copper enzyme maturation permease subunit
MLGIFDYLWRLVPANPILLRVVSTAGKRRRDLFIRCGYLGLLVLLVMILGPGSSSGGLSELAKASASLFQRMSYLQLGLVALLAPIFTAGAITQEKDSQTYDILLTTPLTNGQIVLGSLLSRLFFVIALLVSGIPIFATTQIFGGVAISSIVGSFFIAASTAFVTGALAMAIAVLKVGTRRTIFGFYLFIVIYLVGMFVLDQLPVFQIVGHQTNATIPSHISWFSGLQPFLALHATLHDPAYTPPLPGDLPENLRSWPISWVLTDPAGFYTTFMFVLSFLLVMPSIVLLRRMAQTTTTPVTWLLSKIRAGFADKTRNPRTVWQNPVAWREAKTKGSAIRSSALRYGFIGAGLLGAVVLVWLYSSTQAPTVPDYIDAKSYNIANNTFTVFAADNTPTTLPLDPPPTVTLNGTTVGLGDLHGHLSIVATPQVDSQGNKVGWATLAVTDIPRRLSASQARQFLLGATFVEFAVILLIVTNVAASTVTREKEDGTLDLLLSTPITSRYYIWGKLRGLVSFVLPLVAVPVLSVAVFVAYDMLHFFVDSSETSQWIAFPESLLIMPGTLIIVCAFAAIVGMQMSLRCRKTVVAVMTSVGIVVGLCAVLGFCGMQMVQSSGGETVGVVAGSFSPFTMLAMEIDSAGWAPTAFPTGDSSPRVLIFVFSWVAVGIYASIVWAMYKSMVKNFDMTIRKQSR